MSNTNLPLMGKAVLPLTKFISKARVFFNDSPNNVGREDFPYTKASALFSSVAGSDLMYGVNCPMKNDEQHCRILAVKPSKALIDAWVPKIEAGAGEIESLSFRSEQGIGNPYTVYATYMNHIGSKSIGFISNNDYQMLVNQALAANPGDNIDLRIFEIMSSSTPFHPEAAKDFLIRYLIKNPMTKETCPELNVAFTDKFSDKELGVELDGLWAYGIISYIAMTDYYVNETTIDIIRGCIRSYRQPEWS